MEHEFRSWVLFPIHNIVQFKYKYRLNRINFVSEWIVSEWMNGRTRIKEEKEMHEWLFHGTNPSQKHSKLHFAVCQFHGSGERKKNRWHWMKFDLFVILQMRQHFGWQNDEIGAARMLQMWMNCINILCLSMKELKCLIWSRSSHYHCWCIEIQANAVRFICLFVEAKQILWFYSLESIAFTLGTLSGCARVCMCVWFPGGVHGTTRSTWLLFCITAHVWHSVGQTKCEFHATECRHSQLLLLDFTSTTNSIHSCWLAGRLADRATVVHHLYWIAFYMKFHSLCGFELLLLLLMIWFYHFRMHMCCTKWARLGASWS